jgi:hypothetical protein
MVRFIWNEHVIYKWVQIRTTGFTLSLHGSSGGRASEEEVEKTNPQKKLVHGSSLQKGIVGIDGLGDGLEGVHITRDANEVGGDETNDSQHSSASMADFSLLEPGKERFVGLRKLQLYMREGCKF